MALQECGLNRNKALKELQPHGKLEFPCAGYSSHYTEKQEDIIPWHWHEEIEIIYIEHGKMIIKTPSKTFFLNSGDCIVINTNILHYAVAAPECKLRSLVFSPTLITGNDDLAFAKKYVQPLLSCPSFSSYYVDGRTNENIACWFNCAFEALAGDSDGFEFVVRENLSRICLFLHKEFETQIDTQSMPQSQDSFRIRKMLAYIHKNFADNLSLADISKEANISERECLRCFQKTIQLSPIQYLIKYRVMQGAEMLLKNPVSSISEIAAFCGFGSQSSFAKMFKRFYSCTPREYRNKNTK